MNRRDLLISLPVAGAAPAVPVIGKAESVTKEARIRHHAEALLALVRDELPADATSMYVAVKSNWSPVEALQNRLSVDARSLKAVWKEDARMRGGGYWAEYSPTHWSLNNG